MSVSPRAIAARVQEGVSSELYRLGYTPKSLEETQRSVLWWTYARVQAALNLRPRLWGGWGVAWTSAGYAELVPIEVPRPGWGRVCVEVLVSSVSPGTERAQYLHLPNAQVGVLGRPGYSAAGVVREVGRGVSDLRAGDLVAVSGEAHASVVTAPERRVFRVPQGVSVETASLIMLGIICVHGADVAAVKPGERVVVVGAGPIGILSFRLATSIGRPVAVVASSRRAQSLAEASGASLLALPDDEREIAELEADVVIEATGDPQAVGTAIAAAGSRGRIVLLGSSRGLTHDLPVDQIRAKRLRLVGAHVDTLELVGGEEPDARRAAGERFLAMLRSGSVNVSDLLGPAIDPRRVSTFYRELADGSHSGGAFFDWRRHGSRALVRRAHFLQPPDVLGRGMEPNRPFRPRRVSGEGPFHLSDPMQNAAGRLRIGMIGCGDIAVQNAAGAAMAPNVEITACFDPARRLAEDLAARHGAYAARSQEELLMRSDVDAVLLCVPHDLHAPLAIDSCRAGKNVIVEKPLAQDLASAAAICRAAAESGVWLSVCFPQRYVPEARVARALIDKGVVGDVEGTIIRLFLDKSPAYWQGGFSGRSQSDWRRSRNRAGGGVVIMNLSHHLDLMRHLSGLEVESVTAFSEAPDGIEQSLTANLRYAGGALGSLVGAAAVRGSTEEAFSLWGSEGRIMLTPDARVYTLQPLPGLRTTRWHSFGRLPTAPIRAIYLSRLASAVSEGRPPEVTGDHGIAVQAIIEALYRSASEGTAVEPQQLIAAHGAPTPPAG